MNAPERKGEGIEGDDGRAAKFSLPTSIAATVLALLERKRIHAANSGSRSHPNIRKLKRGRKAVVDFAICHLLLEGRYTQKLWNRDDQILHILHFRMSIQSISHEAN